MNPKFNNTVKVEWLEDDPRNMRLLETVQFVDSSGKIWTALAGHIINGASIPKVFWPITGSPFVGKYRRASVIHDVYCDTRSESHEAVHAMFMEAMLTDGVSDEKAKSMYSAVILGGPKWDEKGDDLAGAVDFTALAEWDPLGDG